MISSGTVKIRNVFGMLDECASGHERVEKKHHWWIKHKGKDFFLQLGRRAVKAKKQREIELGHVRKMIRHLEINTECAKRHLPQLR